MTRAIRNALICWAAITLLIIVQSVWIYTRNGLNGFQAFMQESPFTYIPLTLASTAFVWILMGVFLWALQTNKITKTNLFSWAGFFIVAVSYLNILRERVRYGDIGYYVEAAFKLYNHQPLPDTYIYPPLWATLLSFLTPLGEDGILVICWIANVLSLFAFYYLLHRILEHYQFTSNAAAIITTLFMLVNMPILRTLMYVQVNLHVINLIFLGILLYKDRPFLSALALALAVHFKSSPALLVLAFLLEFNWKWILWFAVNMILIGLFTVAFYGFTPYVEFINNFLILGQPRTLSLRDSSFDSAIGVTLAYFRASAGFTRISVYLAKGIATLFAIVLGVRSHSFYPKIENGTKLYNSIVPFLLAMTIASPLIWEHHGIFLALPFLLLLKKIDSPGEWLLFGSVYLFVFLTPTFDFYPWSYTRLLGILTMLGLLWATQNHKESSFFSKFNTWTNSLLAGYTN